ncbi:MAG: phosphoglycerate kinase [Nanoarchaeota archaeon]|nr:phosphoglycerate kinase [Nanoarchaeota archaeon]
MKSLEYASVKDRIVLLRSDFNSGVVDGKVLISERIKEGSQTIKLLKKKGAKVVVIAHQGRPGSKDFTSLKQHANLINKLVKIKFVPDIFGKVAENEIKNLKSGQAILLENVRTLKSEFRRRKSKFVKRLSSWCDIYVNDAFSVSHRGQASIVGFPKYMESYAGPLLEKEVEALKKRSLKNRLYILSGAKPDDNILLIKKNKVLTGGLFGPMCLVALGKKLGEEEKYMEQNIKNYHKTLKKLRKKLRKAGNLVKNPVDFAVRIKGKVKNINVKDFPLEYHAYDVGEKTIKNYIEEIKKADSIYMKGPLGYYFERPFLRGTTEILKAISKSKAYSLLGGGDLSEAIEMSKISKKGFGHISLSGGALLDYVAGKKLPGLKALGFYRK